jgi:hypothetical protein
MGVPTLGILGLPFESTGQNAILILFLWPTIEYIVRGKVVASPKCEPW